MRVVIDKENLVSFIKQHEARIWHDSEAVLLTELDVEFTFSKQDGEEDEFLSMWLPRLMEYKGPDNKHYFLQPKEEAFKLTPTIHTTWPKPFTSFWSKGPTETVHECRQRGQIMVYGVGSELDFFKDIFLHYPHRDAHRGLIIGGQEFKKWDDLRKYVTPLSDIILIDSYIASDSSLIESNLLPILKLLHYTKKAKTNLIILTEKNHLAPGLSNELLAKKVKTAIEQVPGCTANVTIVLWNNNTRQSRQQYPNLAKFEEHDRTLITNYSRWKTGDTFNYFDSTGQKVTKGRELDLYSLAKRDNLRLINNLINDTNAYLQWCQVNNPENIYGDRKSGLLTIPSKK